MNEIVIRFADKNDAALIAETSRQSFFDTFASFNTKENMDKFLSKQFTAESLMKEVGIDENIFLLAYIENELAGYAMMRETNNVIELKDKNAIEIVRFYATKNSIGKGVGKALMQKCCDVAVEKNKEIIWLCVWEYNQRAIDFYKKKGFEKFSDHVFMLGDDVQNDWKMMKKLL
jgi:ribosomal protein S18 acetylase RimI-like enzyme